MICEAVSLVETLQDGTDVLEVHLSDGRSVYMLYPYVDALLFVGKDVVCQTRKDILHGQVVDVVDVLSKTTEVTTVSQDVMKLKLFSAEQNNNCTVSFKDISIGDTIKGVVLFCTKTELGSSARAEWLTATCVDASGKVRDVRLFSPDTKNCDFDSHYVKMDLTRTVYGFQTESICTIYTMRYESPDVSLAVAYIEAVVRGDDKLLRLVEELKFIERLKNTVYFDRGYYLVRIAYMLYLVDCLSQLTDSIDIVNCKRAVIINHLHLCLTEDNWNPLISNFFLAKKYDMDDAIKLSDFSSEDSDKRSIDRKALRRVMSMADMIIRDRKDVLDV